MSEARALTNLIGNGVATIMVAKWERSLDERAQTATALIEFLVSRRAAARSSYSKGP